MSNRRWTPWANCNPSDWPRVQQMNQQLSRRRENLNTLKNILALLHSFFLSFLNWMPQCVERRKWRANHQIQVQHTKWVQALFHRAMTAASKLSVMIGCAKKKQFSSSHNFVHFRKIQDIILGSSPFQNLKLSFWAKFEHFQHKKTETFFFATFEVA